MRKQWIVALAGFSSLVLLNAGCAPTAIIANGSTYPASKYFGDFGITGHNNNATVDADSNVRKLSIIGDGNNVRVEEGARLFKIEFFGKDNIVSVPEELSWLRRNEVGKNNQIIPRPRAPRNGTVMMRPTDESAPREGNSP